MSHSDALQSATVSGPEPGPHLLVTGGVHGDEFEPMAAVRRLIDKWPRQKTRGRVTLVPVVNEAAFRLGQRTAEDGFDLARVCPGRSDGSVTQRTAHALTTLIRQADFYIDLHTGGTTMEILPLTGYVLHSDAAILETQRRMAHAFNLPVVWGTNARLEGRSLSAARDARVPAIYAEYGGGGPCRADGVEAYVRGTLAVAAALELIRDPPPPESSRVAYVVQDDRDQSGHLQIQHPAPSEGFFEPAVQLEQRVARGAPIGRVVDAVGHAAQTVHAQEDGIILLLRRFPRVQQGDTLAVVLPIDAPGEVRYHRAGP